MSGTPKRLAGGTLRMRAVIAHAARWNERLAPWTLATSCCSVTPNSASFSGSGSTRICWRSPPGI